jgi:glycosyltransferase involved in cell wall biosynthesis
MTPGPAPILVGFVLHVMQVAGAEVLVSEIIRRLGPAIDPVIFCLDAIGPLGEALRAEGVPVIVLDRRPDLDLGVARRMAAHIRQRRIEVIHAHQYTPLFYAALARLWNRRVHVMFTEHGRHYPDVVPAKRRLFNQWLLTHLVDEVNAVAGFSADALGAIEGFGAHEIEVIENGIDVDRYRRQEDLEAIRQRLGLPVGRRSIACIARFHPVKDHATLIRAFAVVARQVPDVDLLFAGDGPMRPEAEAMVRSLGLQKRVMFLGVRRDVAALLQASHVFALNSVSEAASLTVLEAMACGLPVVATAVGGNGEMVRDGIDGMLVARQRPNATALALIRILEDAPLAAAMGRAALSRVHQRYQLDSTIQKYYDRYRRGAERVRGAGIQPARPAFTAATD